MSSSDIPVPENSSMNGFAKNEIIGVFDRAATTYEETGVPFFEPIGRGLVEHAQLRSGERVLDLGTGRGHVLFPAAQEVGPTGFVVGIDLAPTMLSMTQKRIRELSLTNAEVQEGDAENPPVEDGSFDVVLAGLVLFFLNNPQKAFSGAARALKAGGRIVISSFPPPDQRASDIVRGFLEFLPQSILPLNFAMLDSREKVIDFLKPAGFVDPVFSEEIIQMDFPSFDVYVKWLWSNAGRGILESIPSQQFDEAVAHVREISAPYLDLDGHLRINWPVMYSAATRL